MLNQSECPRSPTAMECCEGQQPMWFTRCARLMGFVCSPFVTVPNTSRCDDEGTISIRLSLGLSVNALGLSLSLGSYTDRARDTRLSVLVVDTDYSHHCCCSCCFAVSVVVIVVVCEH